MSDGALLEYRRSDLIVVSRTEQVSMGGPRLLATRRRADDISRHCDVEWMDTEDRSSSLHLRLDRQAQGRAAPPVATSSIRHGDEYTFGYHDDDVFFCTADIGWVTGPHYVVYVPCPWRVSRHVQCANPIGRFWEMMTSTASPSSTPRRLRFAR
jgi:hypothetical protein